MNLGRLLAAVREKLGRSGIEDASLEAEIIVRHVLGLDRADLHSRPERPVSPEEAAAVEALAERRARGEPSAYLTGRRWFYGLDFLVGPGVLIPRPETELLVEVARDAIAVNGYRTAADIGTGSGIIAVCLARLVPALEIIASDVSARALAIARRNAARHGVADRITFCRGDLLAPLPGPVDLVCANLPYVKQSEIPGNGPLAHEPRLALDGGPDGLEVFRAFFPPVVTKLRKGSSLVIEVGAGQAKEVLRLMESALPRGKITVHGDLAGHQRVIEFRLTV